MLINITGIDGCGKGTQIDLLYKSLMKHGKDVIVTKAYDDLEKELFSEYIEYASQIEIMFLFQSFHTKQRIETETALHNGKLVIADRWDETYYGYHNQFGILSKDKEKRDWLNTVAYNNLKPDISFLIDIDPDLSIERCKQRGADFFDRKDKTYHASLKGEYLKIAQKSDQKWVVINVHKDRKEIHKEILSHIKLVI